MKPKDIWVREAMLFTTIKFLIDSNVPTEGHEEVWNCVSLIIFLVLLHAIPASYQMDTGGSFPAGKVAEPCS
jgi:hypothetical protein